MLDYIVVGVLAAGVVYVYLGGPGTATIRALASMAWTEVKGWFGK